MPEITPATEEDAAEFWGCTYCDDTAKVSHDAKPADTRNTPDLTTRADIEARARYQNAYNYAELSKMLAQQAAFVKGAQWAAEQPSEYTKTLERVAGEQWRRAEAAEAALVPEPEPDPEPLAEPTYPGAVVVDRPGLPWVRTLGGMWSWGDQGTTWENIEHPRLPTPAEKAAWGIPDALPDGHVAINPDDYLSPGSLRLVADDIRGEGWPTVAEDVDRLADALEAREANDD